MSVNKFNEENFETEVLRSDKTVIVDFKAEVKESNKVVLVDFYADWCGPCKMMSPIIDEIAEEMPDVKVGKVNVDESGDLAAKYNVSSIPTIMILKEGNVTKTFVGVTDKEEIKGAI